MSWYFKLVGLLLSFLGISVILRQKSSAIAIGFTFGVCFFCISVILPYIAELWDAGRTMLSICDLDPALFTPLLKTVGISICTRITAEMCRDAGERAFGAKIELAGAVAALLCALPLARNVLQLIAGASS